MKDLHGAMKDTFNSWNRIIAAIFLGAMMSALAIGIPVFFTEGNSLSFQLSIMSTTDFLVVLMFAALFGISLIMQLHTLRLSRSTGTSLGKGASSSVFSLIGAVFSANICPACVMTVLGIFGIGGSSAIAIVSYTTEILLVSMTLMLVITLTTSRRLMKMRKGDCCSI